MRVEVFYVESEVECGEDVEGSKVERNRVRLAYTDAIELATINLGRKSSRYNHIPSLQG